MYQKQKRAGIKKPALSIITVSYNSEKTIAETIESVLHQKGIGTEFDLEYILIDGASTDATLEIAKKYEKYFHEILSEEDRGIYDAMNKGLRLASGGFIGLLNSDDYYASEDTLSCVVKEFLEKKVDAVYGDLNYVSPNGEHIIRRWKSRTYEEGLFQKGWHPPHPAFFVKKDLYENYGLFDTNFRIAADYELMLRFLEKHKISSAYLPKTLVQMRTGGTSNRNLTNILKANLECYAAWKKNNLKTNPLFILRKPLSKLGQFRK